MERTGFQINTDLQTANVSSSGPSKPIADNLRPMRLSSITRFHSLSQPSPHSSASKQMNPRTANSLEPNSISIKDPISSQSFPSSFPATDCSNIPFEPDIYQHFAPDGSGNTGQLQTQVPQSSVAHGPNDPAQIFPQYSPWSDSIPTAPIETGRAARTVASHIHAVETSHTPVEQLSTDALTKAANFRLLMPEARSLPFTQRKGTSNSNTIDSNDGAKEKAQRGLLREESSEDATLSAPRKRKRAERRKEPAEVDTEAVSKLKTSVIGKNGAAQGSTSHTFTSKTATKRAKSTAPRAAPAKASAKQPVKTPAAATNAKAAQVRKGKQGTAKKNPAPRKSTPKASARSPAGGPRTTSPKTGRAKITMASQNTSSLAIKTISTFDASVQTTPMPCAVLSSDSNSDIEAPLSCRMPPYREVNSMLFVAEANSLDTLNETTWKILDQYESDLASGKNRFEIAQFYVENLYSARYDFWYAKLEAMNSRCAEQPAL